MLPQHPVNIWELINECFLNIFSKEQRSSLEDDFRIETCWSDFKCFNVKFYISALVGVIIKVNFFRLRNRQNLVRSRFESIRYMCSRVGRISYI